MRIARLAFFFTVAGLPGCDDANEPPGAATSAKEAGAPAATAASTGSAAPSGSAAPTGTGPIDGGGAGSAGGPPSADTDAAAAGPSLCGADDRLITQVSTAWGPAWSKPDPTKIADGWPLAQRYELWWVPMPAGVLSYRITVPAAFDADPSPSAWPGYVRTAESPSTPAASYEGTLSETACDTKSGVPIQSTTPPFAMSPSPTVPPGIGVDVYFRVRPKNGTHCNGDNPLPCLVPGRTYYLNLRLIDGCKLYDGAGNVTSSDSASCQPMIHVMRPKQVGEP